MSENLIKTVLENEKALIPLIFTRKQIGVLRKIKLHKSLSNKERKAMSASIKKKLTALGTICKGRKTYVTNHSSMLKGRIVEAERILEEYSLFGKAFIAGSFLFSKHFNDIDIFIITKRGYHEEWQGKKHLIFLSEKKLSKEVFQSAAQISVSTFPIPNKIQKRRPKLQCLMSDYHEAIIEKMKKEGKQEAARRLIFGYWLFVKNRLLDPKQLNEETSLASLDYLDHMMGKLCRKLFSRNYLYIDLHTYIKTLDESIKNIKPNEHLVRYKNTYEDTIYGHGENKAESA